MLALIEREAGFILGQDNLVQLGDKNDRGPQTRQVMQWFRENTREFPEHVTAIYGNHEDILRQVATECHTNNWQWFLANGGGATDRSYSGGSKLYGRYALKRSLEFFDDWKFLTQEHPAFLETEKYFFCHAPIPKQPLYSSDPSGKHSFKEDLQTLIWSYHGENTEAWVDPNPAEGKICVYGHIHGMRRDMGKLVIPGVRKYGNAYLIDTGCGCHEDGYLTCLELPSMRVYTSRGEVYSIAGE